MKFNKNKKAKIGAWQTIGHPQITEAMLSTELFDWLAVDLEHSPITTDQAQTIFSICKLRNVLPFARLSKMDVKQARQMLDFGAAGLLIPMVEDSNALENFYHKISYANAARGACLSPMNDWGDHFKKYQENFNPIIIPQIESKNGIDNLEAIISHDFVNTIFVGPYDLSASIGLPGNFVHNKFMAQKEKIETISKKNDIELGIHVTVPSCNDLKESIDKGYTFVAFGTDLISMRYPLSQAKKEIKNEI